jgi:hypothetical protein
LKNLTEQLPKSDPETLDKDQKKTIMQNFENITYKDVENIDKKNFPLMYTLCHTYFEFIKVLSFDNEIIVKKRDFMFEQVINLIRLAQESVNDSNNDLLVTFLQEIDKGKLLKFFITDSQADLGFQFVQSILEMEDSMSLYVDLTTQAFRSLISLFETITSFISDDSIQTILLPLLLVLEKSNSKTKRFELSKNVIKDLPWSVKNICGKIAIDLFRKTQIYRKV